MNNEKLKLFRGLGKSLIQSGQKMLKSAFKINYRDITAQYLKSLLNAQYSIPAGAIYCADNIYRITNIETIKKIIEYDWLHEKKYKKDVFDCDNYADSFSSYMAEIFEINTCGTANNIELFTNGKSVGFHRANLILATEDNVIKAYLYEPMNNGLVEINKFADKTKIKSYDYKLSRFEFN